MASRVGRTWAVPDVRSRSLSALAAIALHGLVAALLLTLTPPAPRERKIEDSLKLFVPAPPSPTKRAQRAPRPPPARPSTTHTAENRPASAITLINTAPASLVATAPASMAAITIAAPPVTPTPAPAQTVPKPESDTEIRAYRHRLWSHIARSRPVGIRLEGTCLISFRIDRDGRLLSLHLARSSGTVMLDRLALRTMAGAAPFPPPPDALDEAALNFTIAFSFR